MSRFGSCIEPLSYMTVFETTFSVFLSRDIQMKLSASATKYFLCQYKSLCPNYLNIECLVTITRNCILGDLLYLRTLSKIISI